ncbi:hypothetical protein [Dongia deserti]|uniref:hypothetical protein n=1 Tax=Dongia deserti TaxID=2268030 RepID=UPI000E658F6D|nr:hypothetical protein [Dongia deserti]
MGYTVKIRGRYWRPLGTVEHVQQEIAKVFPSATFAVQHDPILALSRMDRFRAVSQIKVGGPLRFVLRPRLLLSALRRPRYPYFVGREQGDGYVVEFFLGSDPIVSKVFVTLYGSDWDTPGRRCNQLIANTGWVLKP